MLKTDRLYHSDDVLDVYYRERNPVSGKLKLHKAKLSNASYFWHDKPIVIMLPGYTLNHDMPEKVFEQSTSGHIKSLERFLAPSPSKNRPHIYCVSYSHRPDELRLNQYVCGIQHTITDVQPSDESKFLQQVLLPIAGLTSSSKPSAETIRQRLSRLTLVCHSSGCVFANEVSKLFRQHLTHAGYTPHEVDSITREVVAVFLGSPLPLNQESVGFRSLAFGGQSDRRLWYLMGKLGIENEVQAKQEQRSHYEHAGFNADLMESRLSRLEKESYWPRTTHVERKTSSNGFAYFTDVPNTLSWIENGTLHKEKSYVPEHALPMFLVPGVVEKGKIANHHLVQKVTGTITHCTSRKVSTETHWREELLRLAESVNAVRGVA